MRLPYLAIFSKGPVILDSAGRAAGLTSLIKKTRLGLFNFLRVYIMLSYA